MKVSINHSPRNRVLFAIVAAIVAAGILCTGLFVLSNMALVRLSCYDRCEILLPYAGTAKDYQQFEMWPGALHVIVTRDGKRYEYHLIVTKGENLFSFDPPHPPEKREDS